MSSRIASFHSAGCHSPNGTTASRINRSIRERNEAHLSLETEGGIRLPSCRLGMAKITSHAKRNRAEHLMNPSYGISERERVGRRRKIPGTRVLRFIVATLPHVGTTEWLTCPTTFIK